jgi:nitrate/TMAO reductase-like tetraheme cytochrome c subunit
MNTPETNPHKSPLRYLRNWFSLAGLVMVGASLFAFVLLAAIDTFASHSNPYVGVLTYLITPMFSTLGVGMILIGMWMARRNYFKYTDRPIALSIDLARPRDRRILGMFITGSLVFMVITAIGTYQSYNYTESVSFCGETCHTVMQPEHVLYQQSAHARVTCAQCHIGHGAQWFVKAKISGLHQVYGVLADNYARPVPTPIKNLRPARDTCEQCHWPQKFSGNIVRTYDHFLSDKDNTEYAVRLLLRVGGSNPETGKAEGIHWHVNPENKVEYYASDEKRLKIPWVRLTQPGGKVIEYRTTGFTNEISAADIRVMDCLDCHNRPSHRYSPPNEAVNKALELRLIDRTLPYAKSNATWALVQPYANTDEALTKIAQTFTSFYTNDPRGLAAGRAVQTIYTNNFFPAMKASWKNYPEHIGHKDWPGCFRCHDDKHKSADKQHSIKFSDCASCHSILSQGTGADAGKWSPKGEPFKHPEEEYDTAFLCHDCHTGGP